MSDDAITELRREAVEKELAAKALEAARAPETTPEAPPAAPAAPAAPPEIPAAAMVPAPVAASQPQGPQPPPGKAPLQTLDEWEALPDKEQLARMDEVDAMLRAGEK